MLERGGRKSVRGSGALIVPEASPLSSSLLFQRLRLYSSSRHTMSFSRYSNTHPPEVNSLPSLPIQRLDPLNKISSAQSRSQSLQSSSLESSISDDYKIILPQYEKWGRIEQVGLPSTNWHSKRRPHPSLFRVQSSRMNWRGYRIVWRGRLMAGIRMLRGKRYTCVPHLALVHKCLPT